MDAGPEQMSSGAGRDRLTERLVELTPYARIDDPPTARRLGESLGDPTALVDHVAEQLGTADPMVAASVAFQAVTSRAAVPLALANDVLGIGLMPSFDGLRWRIADGEVRIGFSHVAQSDRVPWGHFVARFVEDLVEPWVDVVRAHTTIGRRLLWGNAAASLLAAVDCVVASRPRPTGEVRVLAGQALACLPVAELVVLTEGQGGTAYRRQTCCLIDKAPRYGRCRECSLDRPAQGAASSAGAAASP